MARARRLTGLVLAILVACAGGCGEERQHARCGAWREGDITVALGKDLSVGGQLKRLIERWAQENDVEVHVVWLPATADGQRSQLVARAQSRNPEYDVIAVDVVWTTEFASRGYLQPLSHGIEQEALEREFMPKPLDSARWNARLWALPLNTNVGLLYYRTDLTAAPRSWDELESMASGAPDGMRGFAGQFGSYEGLTVSVLELIWAEGGDLLADGKAVVDARAVSDALARLRRGFHPPSGWIDPEALRYNEEQAMTAFQDGRVLFMRNWPYAYRTLKATGSPVRDRVGVAPLPGAGALGGQNLAIAACSDDKATALKFIKGLTDADNQRALFESGGYPPTRRALYRTERYRSSAVRALARVVARALDDHAKERPQVAGYTEATRLIQTYASAAIRGELSPADAVAKLAAALEDARLD